MTHSPGPWEVDDESIYAQNADGSWQQIAELPGWRTNKGEVMSDTDRANARLIAVAPKMLDSLKSANCPVWVHNADITNDIEALRRIALWYESWWNSQAMPTLTQATGK